MAKDYPVFKKGQKCIVCNKGVKRVAGVIAHCVLNPDHKARLVIRKKRESKNAEIWFGHGISKEGHAALDRAMLLMLKALKAAKGYAEIVFNEADFQLNDLPNRSLEVQERIKWKP